MGYKMIKMFHLLAGTLLLGSIVIFYSLITLQYSRRQHQLAALTLSLANSFDWLILALVLLQFLTGSLLVIEKHYAFSTHWILAAYAVLACTAALWIYIARSRRQLLINLKAAGVASKHPSKLFHAAHWLTIIFLVLIIHDAVVKHTGF